MRLYITAPGLAQSGVPWLPHVTNPRCTTRTGVPSGGGYLATPTSANEHTADLVCAEREDPMDDGGKSWYPRPIASQDVRYSDCLGGA